jgi:lipopolysaccharide/colanic/teichoic acid biosynthesis glycosyltransferase
LIPRVLDIAPAALAHMCAVAPSLNTMQVSVRRCLGLIGAVIALVLLLPLLVAIAVAIKTTSEGPILVRQRRYGKDRRSFTTYAFRTRVWRCSTGHPVAPVTPLGHVLRKHSLYRLPQLISVFSGEISLFGLPFGASADARPDCPQAPARA